MSDLTDLYQEVILDHNRAPRNFGPHADANRRAQGYNPLCGDRVSVTLVVKDDRIEQARFEGSGCAISKASASLMTEAVKGLGLVEAQALFDRFQALLTSPHDSVVDADSFGKLAVFAGVRTFPVRVKCATLAWHTLRAALLQADAPVRTE